MKKIASVIKSELPYIFKYLDLNDKKEIQKIRKINKVKICESLQTKSKTLYPLFKSITRYV